MAQRTILTLVLGSLAGFVGGAIGVGPSVLILPGLLLLGILTDYKMAVGTTLLAILPPLSFFAVLNYYKRKEIDWLVALLLCVAYVPAAQLGAMTNAQTDQRALKYATAVIFFLIGFYFLYAAQAQQK